MPEIVLSHDEFVESATLLQTEGPVLFLYEGKPYRIASMDERTVSLRTAAPGDFDEETIRRIHADFRLRRAVGHLLSEREPERSEIVRRAERLWEIAARSDHRDPLSQGLSAADSTENAARRAENVARAYEETEKILLASKTRAAKKAAHRARYVASELLKKAKRIREFAERQALELREPDERAHEARASLLRLFEDRIDDVLEEAARAGRNGKRLPACLVDPAPPHVADAVYRAYGEALAETILPETTSELRSMGLSEEDCRAVSRWRDKILFAACGTIPLNEASAKDLVAEYENIAPLAEAASVARFKTVSRFLLDRHGPEVDYPVPHVENPYGRTHVEESARLAEKTRTVLSCLPPRMRRAAQLGVEGIVVGAFPRSHVSGGILCVSSDRDYSGDVAHLLGNVVETADRRERAVSEAFLASRTTEPTITKIALTECRTTDLAEPLAGANRNGYTEILGVGISDVLFDRYSLAERDPAFFAHALGRIAS